MNRNHAKVTTFFWKSALQAITILFLSLPTFILPHKKTFSISPIFATFAHININTKTYKTMIRYFQQQDEDSVIRIWLEASAIAHSFIPRSYWESKVPDMRNEYLPQSQTLVNEDEHTNEITGFISLNRQLHRRPFVPPRPARPRNRANSHDSYQITTPRTGIKCLRENTQALTFYKRQGFTITSEQTDKQTGRQEFTMKYQLDA